MNCGGSGLLGAKYCPPGEVKSKYSLESPVRNQYFKDIEEKIFIVIQQKKRLFNHIVCFICYHAGCFRMMMTNDVAEFLEGRYGIVVRVGLHCAPLIHSRIGSGKTGTLRISLSTFNETSQIDTLIEALKAFERMR